MSSQAGIKLGGGCLRRWGEAGIEVAVHPHMLRHSTGYKLANEDRDTRPCSTILDIGIFRAPFEIPS
jgi:hypothetical protein